MREADKFARARDEKENGREGEQEEVAATRTLYEPRDRGGRRRPPRLRGYRDSRREDDRDRRGHSRERRDRRGYDDDRDRDDRDDRDRRDNGTNGDDRKGMLQYTI